MGKIILSEEDRKELVKRYEDMERTPVIGLSVSDMMEGRDFASLARAASWPNLDRAVVQEAVFSRLQWFGCARREQPWPWIEPLGHCESGS